MEELPVVLLRYPVLLAAGLLASLFVCLEIGRAIWRWQQSVAPDRHSEDVGLIESAVFALLGLLIALSFSAAVARFDDRRALIVEEANAIATARLRIDLLPEASRAPLKSAFDRYVRSRADAYRNSDNPREFDAALNRSRAIQAEIWGLAVEGGRQRDADLAADLLLLPALNTMFDITTTRAMAMRMHTPLVVYFVLWISALAAALVAGFSMARRRRSWLDIGTFVAIVTLVLYVLVDLEYPRLGLVQVSGFDSVLFDGTR